MAFEISSNASNSEFVQQAVEMVARRLVPVSMESVDWQVARGRVLAQSIVSDRDSPAIDVSAMDGYAVRLSDVQDNWIPVADTVAAGGLPRSLPFNSAVKVFTGGAVPVEADCVVRREDTDEETSRIRFRVSASSLQLGQSIRRRAENAVAGEQVLAPGCSVSGAAIASIASFGAHRFSVFRKVRVAILNTGDELVEIDSPALPHQIRDSNGPMLESLLGSFPWIELVGRHRVRDDLRSLTETIRSQLLIADAILLTGGVSMGDADYVPDAIRQAGGEILFHKLPIRPGRPILAGRSQGGQLIVGLPGNPVSVAVTFVRFGLAWLRKLGGFARWNPVSPSVTLVNQDNNSLSLEWFRLAELHSPGVASLVETHGSGDLVSMAKSEGFVEIPSGSTGAGPWSWYSWPGS